MTEDRCLGGDDAVVRLVGLAVERLVGLPVERLVGLADEPDGAARVGSSARFWAGAGASAACSIQPPAPLFKS